MISNSNFEEEYPLAPLKGGIFQLNYRGDLHEFPLLRGIRKKLILMNILYKIFSKGIKNKESEDLMKITKVMGPLIDKTANDIFASYRLELIKEPLIYIVPAVWGAKQDGELTVTQKEINKKTAPVIKEIIDLFGFRELSQAQEFAIGYILRGLIISKITYMIEKSKSQGAGKIDSKRKESYNLNRMKPVGRA
jgi:hypothetical protein